MWQRDVLGRIRRPLSHRLGQSPLAAASTQKVPLRTQADQQGQFDAGQFLQHPNQPMVI